MRKPLYLSPSSLSKFDEAPDEFFLIYLAENKPGRLPQTPPMAVGSSFDAHVKSELYNRAFGDIDPEYTFEALFEKQVEAHNRDEALTAGKWVYNCYLQSGAFNDLDLLLKESACAPQFEFKVEGVIGGVPMLGKPDCRFIHKSGIHVIFDWKVNGYYGKRTTSPAKFYLRVLDGFTPATKSHGKRHTFCTVGELGGVQIYTGWLEEVDSDWANQLSTYAWMLNEPVGDESWVAAIDQVVCKPGETSPQIRVAQHRACVSERWQRALLSRYQKCWGAIESNHIFTNLDPDASRERCEKLENKARIISDGSPLGAYINATTRERW